jgi:hypothetical protein
LVPATPAKRKPISEVVNTSPLWKVHLYRNFGDLEISGTIIRDIGTMMTVGKEFVKVVVIFRAKFSAEGPP